MPNNSGTKMFGHRWYYRLPGSKVTLGPSVRRYAGKKEFVAALQEAFGKMQLPKKLEVWPRPDGGDACRLL